MLRRVFFRFANRSLRSAYFALGLLIPFLISTGSGKAFALKATEASEPAVEVRLAALPSEAKAVIVLIRKGGPYPYPKDGVVFGNREKILPKQARGYYTEYTVKTPGERTRGARRIVVGGEPRASTELYYSDDHYQSFKRIRE